MKMNKEKFFELLKKVGGKTCKIGYLYSGTIGMQYIVLRRIGSEPIDDITTLWSGRFREKFGGMIYGQPATKVALDNFLEFQKHLDDYQKGLDK